MKKISLIFWKIHVVTCVPGLVFSRAIRLCNISFCWFHNMKISQKFKIPLDGRPLCLVLKVHEMGPYSQSLKSGPCWEAFLFLSIMEPILQTKLRLLDRRWKQGSSNWPGQWILNSGYSAPLRISGAHLQTGCWQGSSRLFHNTHNLCDIACYRISKKL